MYKVILKSNHDEVMTVQAKSGLRSQARTDVTKHKHRTV